jgi:threonine dehydratase
MSDGFSPEEVAHEVELAETRIWPYVRETPLELSPFLSRRTGSVVNLKFENLQVTGSFKARGAFNRLLTLDAEERLKGVVTASTGNHANAMAHAMSLLGIKGEIFLPSNASAAKLDALRVRGATLRLVDTQEYEVMAREEAAKTGRFYVSPYNDPMVVAGAGTVASETARQLERFDAVFVPVGGGGLMAGIAGYLKIARPQVRIVGCLPVNSPVMERCVRAGRVVDVPAGPTLADGVTGPIDEGSITFPLCRDLVDEWVLVSEEEIASAIRLIMGSHSVMVEGAGALSVAGFLQARDMFAGRNVVLVLSGSRIPLDVLANVIR